MGVRFPFHNNIIQVPVTHKRTREIVIFRLRRRDDLLLVIW